MIPWESIKQFEVLNSYLKQPDIYELMQFTGLHDRNGKEIYEGDIIKYDRVPFLTTVNYVDCTFALVHDRYEQQIGFLNDESMGMLEVIGNIYENPELLRSGEDH